MKLPVWFNDEIVGYEDDKVIDNGETVRIMFHLFDTKYLDIIKKDILKSSKSSITSYFPDLDNINNNELFKFEIIDNVLILYK